MSSENAGEKPRQPRRLLKWFAAAGAGVGLLWGLATVGAQVERGDWAMMIGYLLGSVLFCALLGVAVGFMADL